MKQREFLYVLEALVDDNKRVDYVDVAKTISVSKATLYNWRRDHLFNKMTARIVASHADLQYELVHRAAMRQAMKGSPIHYELILRKLGQYDTGRERDNGGDPAQPGAGATYAQQVNFYGLPACPSPEEARRMLPPPGSNMILPAPAKPTTGVQ